MQIYTNCGYNQSQLEKKSEIKKCEDKRMNPNVDNFIPLNQKILNNEQ